MSLDPWIVVTNAIAALVTYYLTRNYLKSRGDK